MLQACLPACLYRQAGNWVFVWNVIGYEALLFNVKNVKKLRKALF
jgi:hypothetical protein